MFTPGMTDDQIKPKMTDDQIDQWINEARKMYAAGEFPEWQIKRIERMPGWSWK